MQPLTLLFLNKDGKQLKSSQSNLFKIYTTRICKKMINHCYDFTHLFPQEDAATPSFTAVCNVLTLMGAAEEPEDAWEGE